VRELKPDIILPLHSLDWRDDHRRVGLAAADACLKASLPLVETRYPYHRPAPDLYFCGTPMAPLEPNVFIDVADYMDVNIEAFRQHSSQLVKWEIDSGFDDLEDILKRYRHRFRQYGVESGVNTPRLLFQRTGEREPSISYLQSVEDEQEGSAAPQNA
jgi:LmbE family N-acetylglucosaminyl deacetylase